MAEGFGRDWGYVRVGAYICVYAIVLIGGALLIGHVSRVSSGGGEVLNETANQALIGTVRPELAQASPRESIPPVEDGAVATSNASTESEQFSSPASLVGVLSATPEVDSSQPAIQTHKAAAGRDGLKLSHNDSQGHLGGELRQPTAGESHASQESLASGTDEEHVAEEALPELRSISGRVLDPHGEAVADIELLLRPHRLSGELNQETQLFTVSDDYGYYQFEDASDGEYIVSAAAQAGYERARIAVRAGVDFANLTLMPIEWDLRVEGMVTDANGAPIPRAKVLVGTARTNLAFTDATGKYELFVHGVAQREQMFVEFTRDGFKPQKALLHALGRESASVRLDASLEQMRESVGVSGFITNTLGEPVRNVSVGMYSRTIGRRYSAQTNATGLFQLDDVGTANDYVLNVYPRVDYKDYERSGVHVAKGSNSLSIELEPRDARASLSGEIVNGYGDPVSGLTLALISDQARNQRLTVTSGAAGDFVLNDVPSGKLSFQSTSTPQFKVSGIALDNGESEHVLLTLDLGEHEMRGVIVDEHDYAVPVRDVFLTWIHTENGVRSWSSRKTSADAAGEFSFSGLGPGMHTLLIRAPGFKPAQIKHDVEGNDELRIVLKTG